MRVSITLTMDIENVLWLKQEAEKINSKPGDVVNTLVEKKKKEKEK